MMHTFSYKSGFIHETVENGVREVRWQCGKRHGRAHSVHGAKCAITRQERANNQNGEKKMKEIAHNIAALIQRERRSSEARELAESLTGPAQDIVLTYLAEQVDGDPVLYVHDSGDVILWPSEDAAEDDDGRNALERWSVSPEAAEALAELDNS